MNTIHELFLEYYYSRKLTESEKFSSGNSYRMFYRLLSVLLDGNFSRKYLDNKILSFAETLEFVKELHPSVGNLLKDKSEFDQFEMLYWYTMEVWHDIEDEEK